MYVDAFVRVLSYFCLYRPAALPANLGKGQGDQFGTQVYRVVDASRGKSFHTNQRRREGDTLSTS